MSTTNCFSCGSAISDRQIFCTKCGTPAIRKCPRCGAKFAGNVQACSKCGLDAVLMSDAMLVRLAAEQNQTAITKLYEKTYKRYYMICREMLQSRSSGDAEDALQDAYVKMFSSLDKLDDVTKFEAWGATIVRNTCLDILRKNSPVLFDDEALMDAIDYTPTRVYASFEDDPSEYFDQKEVSVLVNQMLLSSPEEQRICIMMYYSQDMSVKNIARELNISENTVKSRLKYGRANIEKQVLKMEKEQGIRLHNLLPFPFFIAALTAYTSEAEASVLVSEATKATILHLAAAKALTAGASGASGAAGAAGTSGAAGASGAAGGTSATAGQQTGGNAIAKAVKSAVAFVKEKLTGASAGKAAAVAKKALTSSIAIKGVEVPSSVVVIGTLALTGAVGSMVTSGTDKDLIKAYADEIQDLESTYGSASIVESPDGMYQYMDGLSGTSIFDFDGDEKDDLLVIYANGNTAGLLGNPFVKGGSGYTVEILTWKRGKKQSLLKCETIGDLQHVYALDAGRAGMANLLVMENAKGKRVVQLRFNHTDDGLLSFRNYYYEKGKTKETVFSAENGIWRKDGEEISAKEWIEEVTPVNILYNPLLSNSWMIYEDTEIPADEETYETTPDRPLLKTAQMVDDLKEELSQGSVKQSENSKDYVRFYSVIAMECDLLNYGVISDFEPDSEGSSYYSKLLGNLSISQLNSEYNNSTYVCSLVYRAADMDKDGTPEMIVSNNSYEGPEFTYIFSIKDGELVFCGEFPYYAYKMYSGEKPGIIALTYQGSNYEKLILKDGVVSSESVNNREGYSIVVPEFDPAILLQVSYPVE